MQEVSVATAISTGTEEDDDGELLGPLLKEDGRRGEGRVEEAEAMLMLMAGTPEANLRGEGWVEVAGVEGEEESLWAHEEVGEWHGEGTRA